MGSIVMDSSNIRIALAEDYHVVREGVASMLDREPDLEVVGQVSDGYSVLAMLEQTQVDILLLDAKMSGLTVTEQVALIRQQHPQTKVVVLSAYKQPEYVRGVIRKGASGYVLKDDAADMLVDAVREVARGGRYFSPRIEAIALNGILDGEDEDDAGLLKSREMRVLYLITIGYRNEQIAEDLHASTQTVKNICQIIFRKLGVNSRVEAVVKAIQLGLINPDDLPFDEV